MTKGLRYSAMLTVAAMVMAGGCRNIPQVVESPRMVAQVSADALRASCFVRKYEADGSYYMTRQQQSIEPYTGIVQLSGAEPDGHYFWQLSGGAFIEMKGLASEAKWLPSHLSAADYCRLVLGCFQAGMVGQSQDAVSPVRIRGNWAYPVKSDGPLVWYQSGRDSAVADVVTLEIADGSRYIACGYGYHPARDAQMLVPAKIEVFMVKAAAGTEEMLLRLDYMD